MNETTVRNHHLSQKFVVVVTSEPTKNHTNALNDIFEVLWSNGLINSQVLAKDASDTWSLSTFIPFQKHCISLAKLKIASFSTLNYTENMTVPAEKLFPKKLNDFNQCPLHIALSLVCKQMRCKLN